ncbi:hypothetical protein SAMN05660909_05135 [Chitinophaga terrae (ex Kim and Jung 2007)]|uniref:Uncharacterized protein n=1 Tax=Chitinophaga terrae (ex Kim and Jung 2007) TaxID=408074 RepID=A0A1H4GDD4_9BACT|nr:hypothetical protein [Chitinophaga terrae (ex Kim and Jung 2007)]GEP93298.1 hypothetical protein CTE07_49430 [Chitinophaga terrae (ex Kim and Jung 2007)]SEB06918.1 hypothetical protein SAMN05660909_05135 [Chitinophaga terrae (ex Kim and Jung 2007)]
MVINVVAVINGALLTNLAVAVNVETMVNIDFEVSDITQADGLSREKLVASIAQNI